MKKAEKSATKNSLVAIINARKKSDTSRSETKSAISDKAYKNAKQLGKEKISLKDPMRFSVVYASAIDVL